MIQYVVKMETFGWVEKQNMRIVVFYPNEKREKVIYIYIYIYIIVRVCVCVCVGGWVCVSIYLYMELY